LPAVIIALFLISWFLALNHKKVRKSILFSYTVILLLLAFLELDVFIRYLNMLSEVGKTLVTETNLFYNLYNKTLFAIDFKPLSLSYSIASNLGNAVFLKFYPLFGFFFGPKGIFVNSPFLLFSFLGMTLIRKEMKLKLLLLLAFLVLFITYLSMDYEGGFTPRYVRHAEPIIIILTIFLAEYLAKLKEKKILLIFAFLAFISITNSISLAIRTDWNYEKITDLFSYDIVLWPWVEPMKDKTILQLYDSVEQRKWNLNFPKICNPPVTEPRFSEVGIETGPCGCNFINNASRKLILPKDSNALRIEVCSKFAGGDGVSAYVYVDNKEVAKLQIKSSTCTNIIANISQFADNKEHILTLESRRYKDCIEEVAIWRKVELVKYEKFPFYEFDLTGEIEKWESSNKICKADFTPEYIRTDFCECLSSAEAVYNFELKDGKDVKLKIIACADFAGGDGIIGEVVVDNNLIGQVFIKSYNCTTFKKTVTLEKGIHTLKLKPKIYGECSAEWVKWREVIIA
jgi:hypothetical protein